MPELPEVETIRIGLQKKIVGQTIKEIEVLSPKSFIGDSKNVSSRKVLNIRRFSKLLSIDLSSGISLAIHLKMTGQLIWKGESEKGKGERFIGGHPTPDMVGPLPNKTTRVIFTFSDQSKLYFNDQRRFGWIKIVETSKIALEKYVEGLGPEPLEKEFTWQILKSNLLNHKSQAIKVALMDQSVVSGVGNIYANEACFNAKLDPKIAPSKMTDKQFRALYKGVIKALQDGIRYGGSSRAHFVDPDGHKGYFLDYAYVYWRDKHPCKICGTEIKKVQLGGRGSYFCPNCQSS